MADAVFLAVDNSKIWGKEAGKELEAAPLGTPYMDVVLQPGEVLYVPRGALHTTSTPPGGGTSLHLTAGIEVVNVDGDATNYHFLGGAPKTPEGRALLPALQRALAQLAAKNLTMRKGVAREVVRAGKFYATTSGRGQEAGQQPPPVSVLPSGEWKDGLRELMHVRLSARRFGRRHTVLSDACSRSSSTPRRVSHEQASKTPLGAPQACAPWGAGWGGTGT